MFVEAFVVSVSTELDQFPRIMANVSSFAPLVDVSQTVDETTATRYPQLAFISSIESAEKLSPKYKPTWS